MQNMCIDYMTSGCTVVTCLMCKVMKEIELLAIAESESNFSLFFPFVVFNLSLNCSLNFNEQQVNFLFKSGAFQVKIDVFSRKLSIDAFQPAGKITYVH